MERGESLGERAQESVGSRGEGPGGPGGPGRRRGV